MPDSVQVFPPGFRITDANGNPVSGAKLNFYDAGTTDQQTVYSDSGLATVLPNPVVCDSAGAPTSDGNAVTEIYVGTAAYKVVITDSSDVTLFTFDDIKGAVDTSGFSGGSGTFQTPVNSETSDFSVDSDYYGDLTSCDPTGATFTATLPSAVTAGDGTRIGLRHDGTSNEVKIATVSGQSIKLPGGTTTAGFALTGKGHTAWLVSDGAGWTLDIEIHPIGHGVISITDQLTAPPVSPNGGARYILNGTGTGDWASFSEHDILEADGQGGWIQYTPADGWLAYIIDENVYYSFQDTEWVALNNVAAPAASTVPTAIFENQQSNNTNGGAAATTTWTVHTLNTEVENDITGCSLSSNQVTIPAGTYRVKAMHQHFDSDTVRLRFRSTTTSKEVKSLNSEHAQVDGVGVAPVAEGIITLTSAEIFELSYYRDTNATAQDLGVPANAGDTEIYGRVIIEDIARQQGPAGAQGAQGAAGADGATGPTGATGATGSNGQVLIDYTFDSASQADSDPGSGVIRADNATAASVTAFYIDDLDRLGVDQSTAIDAFDASTSTGTKSTMYMEDLTSGERWTYDITAASDSSGYWELTVTHVAGTGSFASNNVAITVIPRGDKGADGAGSGDVVGPASAVDNRVATFDSITGKLLQDGGKTIAEIEASAAATAESNIRDGVGSAFDTLSEIATELNTKVDATSGTAVQKADGSGGLEDAAATDLGAGTHTIFVPAGAMVPRTTNGAAEGDTELSTNDVMLRTLDFDTSTEEGAGFFIAMPKSWNESTVTFIPYWTAGSGSGGVVWGLAGYSFSDNDALDTAVSGQQTSTDTFITANDCHVGAASSAITIGGTPAEGDIVYFEVTREVADGSDTLGVDALLIGIKLLFTTSAINDA